jgi:hypothetical protein
MVVLLLGLAWPLVGLGYHAIQFGSVPRGVSLAAAAVGLLLAGMATSALLLAVRAALPSDVGRGTLLATYIMFSAVGIMAAFLVNGLLEQALGPSPITFLLVSPLLLALTATVLVGLGLGIAGGLARGVHSVVARGRRGPAASEASPARTPPGQ